MPVLPLRIHHDGLLSVVGPLGAAAAGGTALVVDLHPLGPPLPGDAVGLARIVADGPTMADLTPARPGVAVLGAGGVDPSDAEAVVGALIGGWPLVVIRLGPGAAWRGSAIDVVPIFGPIPDVPVYQPTGLVPVPRGLGGVVLPPLPSGVARALAAGRQAGGRWVQAWRRVWELAA